MKYAIVTVAVVLLVTFGAEHQFDLGSYLASPPLRGGLASRTDLLHVYGPGCVRLDQNPPGVPQWEHHVYAVPDEGVWIVATVVARGRTMPIWLVYR